MHEIIENTQDKASQISHEEFDGYLTKTSFFVPTNEPAINR
jgi:hypothetical protein